MDSKQLVAEAIVTPELYFLISKFLSVGPLQETAKVLIRELEEKKVLPKRTDWLGNEHEQSFAELEQKYSHINPNHLLEICCRIGPILDKELPPSVTGIVSLLGSGRQSLLRTTETIYRSRSLLDYCTRLHGVPLPDSALTKPIHNFQKVLIGREYGGPMRRKLLMPTSFYSKTILLRRTVGHLSSVYCVLFDRTGQYIITGADDLLIKIWSATDGRLLATLRGASSEITDIAINLDNTMLAAGSLDRILRVWDLQTTSPIAVLPGHTGMITSVNFCPSPRGDLKYLVTTSTDGSIAFWQYSTPRGQKTTFAPKPTQYHEKLRPGQAQMICTSFSPGGMFLAAGSADHHVRVYIMSEDGPKRILESEVYTDTVDSVQWSHRGLRFISGSKDGTAHIWTFESQQWKSTKLCMTERLPSCPELEEGKKLKVTMVAWDYSDKYVITAVNDFTIKIWNSKTAKLHCVLRGHKDELYVLESNPRDEHILLSAGHDGQVFLWDIEHGKSVANYLNDIDGQGHGGVFDAKWSPDGTMIAATDSHGHLLIFGLGISPEKYKILPNELFFHTDYRPLLRDAAHHVVDEQTQVMPHLMPPPFLVDADGNPHPARFQRFVPGRENCSSEQLIPNFSLGPDGALIEDNGNPATSNYSQIDRLIAALANRQGAGPAAQVQGGSNNENSYNRSHIDRMIEALANRQDRAPDSNNRSALNREVGNVLGNGRNNEQFLRRGLQDGNNAPRQGTSWGRPPEQQQQQQQQQQQVEHFIPATQLKYVRRIYVRPMKYAKLQNLKQVVYAAGQYEMQEYKREMRRRPIMINTANSIASSIQSGNTVRQRTVGRRRGNQSGQSRPVYRTRAVRDQEQIISLPPPPPPDDDEEDEESSATSGDTSYSNVVAENLEGSSDDSDSESSDYSDWVADTPGPNLEPPKRKRSKRKPLSRQQTFSEDSSSETNTEQATTSAGAAAKAARRMKRGVAIPPPNGEIPEIYRPAEWLSEVIPRKAPYYPQMGDEIVYFRQGHQRYLDAVRQKKVYKLTHSSEPWNFRTLRDHEFVRVIGIKYEIRPPRLCCLKLAMIDEDGNMTGTSFKIKYHDMPDVLDFLVLRQTYDLAVQRNWSIGDRFRCMIGDGWWMGQIESRHPLSPEFPDSYFMCFHVRWDNGEYEYMSPWDMEPIDEQRLPEEEGGAVPVLPEEIRATLYQPKSEEWHRGDRDGSCRRIINGLEQIMRLSIAEHFLAPVDLNIYPDYAYLIEYPIDLTTIKSRFENHFYRRITSAQFDVRYLATNAEKYNRSHTNIVKHARIITDLCLRIIRESNDVDVAAVYHQLVDVYHSSETENDDNESDIVPSTSTGPTTSAAAARQRMSGSNRRTNSIRTDGTDWRADCRQLLDMMWQRPDSVPFREPVDTIEFPDYLEIIATPMDLRTVKEDLLGGNYDDPMDFAKDVRLIFQNSKNYNTNKRSRIYSMTLRLSALFESHIKTVVSNWRKAMRRNKKNMSKRSSSSPTKRNSGDRVRAGPSTRRTQKSVALRRLHNSEDDDDEEEDEDDESYSGRQRGRQRRINGRNGSTRNGNLVASISTSSSNRVTSSSSHRRDDRDQVIPARSSRRRTANQQMEVDEEDEDDDDDDDDEEMAVTEESMMTSSMNEADTTEATSDNATDSHDDDQDSTPEHRQGHRRRGRRKRNRSIGDASEESYKPIGRPRGRKPNKGRRKRRGRPPANHHVADDGSGEEVSRNYRSKARGINNSKNLRRLASSDEEAGTVATLSQVDESTQDTVSHTPKKKGRPPKNSTNGPSTSASALQQSPARATRNGSKTRRHATANDHSYHLPVRTGRLVESDEDSRPDGIAARSTRASVKRALQDWARATESEEEEDEEEEESEEAEEILPTPTPHKPSQNGTANGPSTSRTAANGTTLRQLRTNRNTVVEPPDDESNEENSDNEPLASSSHNRVSKNSLHIRKVASKVDTSNELSAAVSSNRTGSSHMTRSHATSTTSNVATSSSSATTSQFGATHNNRSFVSDPQPSTSRSSQRHSTMRNALLRHQQIEDDLDTSTDPLEQLNIPTRLRRSVPTSTSGTSSSVTASTTAETNLRRGRSRYSQENSQPEENDNDDDDEEGASDEGTDGSSTHNDDDEDDASDDSEDNQPLTSYVPAAKRTRNHDLNTVRNGLKRSGRRIQKRPHYNEDSDDAEVVGRQKRQRRDIGSYDVGSTTRTSNRILPDRDNDDDGSTVDSDDQLVSVSSRGRVRKISAKARGIFKE